MPQLLDRLLNGLRIGLAGQELDALSTQGLLITKARYVRTIQLALGAAVIKGYEEVAEILAQEFVLPGCEDPASAVVSVLALDEGL